ncbi:MAG: hypothetical protein K8F60_11810 [Melioribacteraceae bacterium]|jgi:hypothetical protein|nr:hypothetical protein [Ignavibacteriota bacterium]MBZ0183134.1 hypothetical protein [Melioribacteraceae bacterium]|tara:strand:+ start:140 stop:649 length:510 start_codon:yes stop_codon:yes gene_type:complete
MNNKLYQLNNDLKKILFLFVFTLTVGVTVGVFYLQVTTKLTPDGTVSRYKGDIAEEEFEIPENYPKSIGELLLTTHNHIIGFSFIFILLGLIFYFNSIINGKLKMFFIIEPFISTSVTFGSLWLVRFVHENFVYLTIISAVLLYFSFYLMSFITMYELIFKKNSSRQTL